MGTMNRIERYLQLAAGVSRLKDDNRTYFHGAVGIRKDGVIVCAYNGAPKEPEPRHHCESRILRKLGRGGVIYLVRTRADGSYADSTPCIYCQKAIKARDVSMVHYTTGDSRVYESWDTFGAPPTYRTLGTTIEV